MKATLDTNIIVRLLVVDDADQAWQAARIVTTATLATIPATALCEAAWVLKSRYHFDTASIAAAFQRLLSIPGIVTQRDHAAAGFAFLDAGADFADGVIASEGRALGGETFLTFDTDAARAAQRNGIAAVVPD